MIPLEELPAPTRRRHIRIEFGLTQTQLAALIGVSRSSRESLGKRTERTDRIGPNPLRDSPSPIDSVWGWWAVTQSTDGRLLLSVREMAEVLGIGRDAAYRAANAGEIPTIRIGRRLYVPRTALLRWIDIQASGDVNGTSQ